MQVTPFHGGRHDLHFVAAGWSRAASILPVQRVRLALPFLPEDKRGVADGNDREEDRTLIVEQQAQTANENNHLAFPFIFDGIFCAEQTNIVADSEAVFVEPRYLLKLYGKRLRESLSNTKRT